MNIQKVAVIGGGLMGRQIALNTAIYPYEVRLFEVNPAVREAVQKWEDEYLAGRIAKGRMSEEQVAGIRSRFVITQTMEEAVADADLVIEAVVERKEIKHAVMRQLGELTRADCIVATNSSYMVSSTFRDDLPNPGRLLNLHYFNPALVMKLVEVVRGDHTSDEVVDAAYDFCQKTGKTPIRVEKEIDGFIVNRILTAINQEARFLVDEGYCTYQDLDTACENGLGHPKGPFRLADLTGLDLALDIMNRRYQESGVKPSGYDMFKEKVEAGKCGMKSGEGFYKYPAK